MKSRVNAQVVRDVLALIAIGLIAGGAGVRWGAAIGVIAGGSLLFVLVVFSYLKGRT